MAPERELSADDAPMVADALRLVKILTEANNRLVEKNLVLMTENDRLKNLLREAGLKHRLGEDADGS